LITPKKSFPFRPGMSASADIQTKTKANVLSVALNAVTTRDKNGDSKAKSDSKDDTKKDDNTAKSISADDDIQEVVFVLQKDNTVKKIRVRTAVQDLNNIEILSGLKEGDEVVTGPYTIVSKTLKDGAKVMVVAKDKLYDDKKKD
jgi:HlyD family secretion protein